MKSIEEIRIQAELGDADAQFSMAQYYDFDEVEALKWYKIAVENGHVFALRNLYKKIKQGDKSSFEWLVKVAEKGNAEVQNTVGDLYCLDVGDLLNEEQAVKWYGKSAKQGLADARYNLAVCYRDGCGIDQSDDEAFSLFKHLAEEGDSDAQNIIGMYYALGKVFFGLEGLRTDLEGRLAIEWLHKSASQHHVDAIYNISVCYLLEIGVEQNLELAFEWAEKAAKLSEPNSEVLLSFYYGFGVNHFDLVLEGHWYSKSLCKLRYYRTHGNAYREGRGNKQLTGFICALLESEDMEEIRKRSSALLFIGLYSSKDYLSERCLYSSKDYLSERCLYKAFKYFNKAARLGNMIGQYCLATCYMDGRGVERDEEQAFYWMKCSAEQGLIVAEYRMGVLAEKGKTVNQGLNNAFKWYKKAAYKGMEDAQYKLAMCYKNGAGVISDGAKALEWLLVACNNKQLDALYELGLIYLYGEGVVQNDLKASELFMDAALRGHSCATFELACWLGDEITLEDSICYLEELAEPENNQYYQKRTIAQNYLAWCYFDGYGVKQSYSNAFKWFLLAAKDNDLDSKYQLALMYGQGLGTKTNSKEAIKWFEEFYLNKTGIFFDTQFFEMMEQAYYPVLFICVYYNVIKPERGFYIADFYGENIERLDLAWPERKFGLVENISLVDEEILCNEWVLITINDFILEPEKYVNYLR
uniref:Secretory immunoglobulin A-binding protein EsiB n=1 Tax=Aliivibrio wodanis TaxID=80852 RepID=A0A5Q4ZVZ7_9GAMM|nr:Secretory immunoglobulin A-binding protein EsiB [Aliivibrio wodanis]